MKVSFARQSDGNEYNCAREVLRGERWAVEKWEVSFPFVGKKLQKRR